MKNGIVGPIVVTFLALLALVWLAMRDPSDLMQACKERCAKLGAPSWSYKTGVNAGCSCGGPTP